MAEELADAFESANGDPAVGAIVVTGNGRGFCAGADMDALKDIGDGNLESAASQADPRPQAFPLGIPKPVIAAIKGACAGIGLV